jgi:hypothetical protein
MPATGEIHCDSALSNTILLRLRDGNDARLGSTVRKYNSFDPKDCWYVEAICQDRNPLSPLGYVATLVGERPESYGTGNDLVLMMV